MPAPRSCAKSSIRSVRLGKMGSGYRTVRGYVCCPKQHWNARTKRCRKGKQKYFR